MSATGASPTYFDFDAFKEINVTTGGTDLTMQTGGIGINMVTKRGTNNFHGGARYIIANDDWQSGNVPDRDGERPAPQERASDKADHIQQITDYGFDLGGPIVKDKLWFYGTYGKQDIRLQRLMGQTEDKTLLPSDNGKLNWQVTGRGRCSPPSTSSARRRSSAAAWAVAVREPTASPGTRTTPTPKAASPAASGRPRSTTPSRPTSS